MAQTPNLNLSYLAPAQAQKHVTVNEGLGELDALVQCAVLEMGRDAPPAAPAEGARYLVGASPEADWSGQGGRLATWREGGWAFSLPRPGWRVYDLGTDTLFALTSAGAWAAVSGGGAPSEIQNATRIGLGTTAGAAAPFAAELNAALFAARPAAAGGTGQIHVVLSKPSADRDAGHLFQTGAVTRALAGLFGSNRYRVAVSADGAAFVDALTVHETSGVVDLPRQPRFKAHTNFDNFVALDAWTKLGINVAEANETGAFDAATNRFTAPAAGFYLFGATLLHRINASNAARMRGRLVVNGATELRGSFGEVSGAHVTLQTALWLQAATALAAGDTVELQGSYRIADGYFAAGHTSFWGFKVG
jgi:hypothetical protein